MQNFRSQGLESSSMSCVAKRQTIFWRNERRTWCDDGETWCCRRLTRHNSRHRRTRHLRPSTERNLTVPRFVDSSHKARRYDRSNLTVRRSEKISNHTARCCGTRRLTRWFFYLKISNPFRFSTLISLAIFQRLPNLFKLSVHFIRSPMIFFKYYFVVCSQA